MKNSPEYSVNYSEIFESSPNFKSTEPLFINNGLKILPKHEYTEVHNPDYYYPGWIAQDSANDPLNNATRITKTGKYYNMNRAVSTKNDLHNEIPKQEVSKIKVEKIKQKEQKNVNKSSDKKLSSEDITKFMY